MALDYHLNRHVYVIVKQRGAIPVFAVNSELKAALILARFDYQIGPCLVYYGKIDKGGQLENVSARIGKLVKKFRLAIPSTGKEEMPVDYDVSSDPALETYKSLRIR